MNVEGVLLTGGASRRMGEDKSRLVLDGEAVSRRIARDLQSACETVTVLGREPISGCKFLADTEEYAGPLAALSRFLPSAEFVFVASCDLPRFDARLIGLFCSRIEASDAVLPTNEGRVQPLCALYDAQSWVALRKTVEENRRSMMAWLDLLNCVKLNPAEVTAVGIDDRAICGANTPEEWQRLIKPKETH